MEILKENIYLKNIICNNKYVCTEVIDFNEYVENPINDILKLVEPIFYKTDKPIINYIIVNPSNEQWKEELRLNTYYCQIFYDYDYNLEKENVISNNSKVNLIENEFELKEDIFNYFNEYEDFDRSLFEKYANFIESNSGLSFKDKPLSFLSNGEKCLLNLCKYLSGRNKFNFKNSLCSLSNINFMIVIALLKSIIFDRSVEINFFSNKNQGLFKKHMDFLIKDGD